jgi:hypothetical protein
MRNKHILIISPHFPPSNLAAVHRSRLFAQHLPSFGWEPTILTVHEKYYEEDLDRNLEKLLPAALHIEKVSAFRVTKPRVIGDIGLRGFFQLYRGAKKIINNKGIDFLYIPVPSFYTALLGRWLHITTGVKYGIDYIDPWVHKFPGSNRLFSRAWWSTKVAQFLEPIAIKNVSLITGVAEGYYQAVLERNPFLKSTCLTGGMPYGGEKEDHLTVRQLGLKSYLFNKKENKLQMVYAGAMLPKAYAPLEQLFKSIQGNIEIFRTAEFHFIGTGRTPDDPEGYNIKPLAEKYGLWNNVVFEYPKRIPYLDVLIHLEAADAVFILGSTEPHYTPSKVYQATLSHKPILAVLHKESSACRVIRDFKIGVLLDFNGEEELDRLNIEFSQAFSSFISFTQNFNPGKSIPEGLGIYSAKNVTAKLVSLLNQAVT